MSRKLNSIIQRRGGGDALDRPGSSDNREFNPHMHSIHGANYWDTIKKQVGGKNETKRMSRIVSDGNLRGNDLNLSSHF